MQRVTISPYRLAMRSHAWVLLFPLFFNVVFGVIGLLALQSAQLLDRYGVEGTAVVTDKDIRESRDSDGRRSYTYYLSYDWSLQGGGMHSGRSSVQRSRYNATAVGDSIAILYVPHDPDTHEIEIGNNRLFGLLFLGVSAVSMIVLAGIAAFFYRRIGAKLRAVRRGEVREARVLSIQQTNTTANNHRMWRLHWRDATGEIGQSGMMRRDRLEPFPEGSVIVVYLDPVSGQGFWEEELSPGAAEPRRAA